MIESLKTKHFRCLNFFSSEFSNILEITEQKQLSLWGGQRSSKRNFCPKSIITENEKKKKKSQKHQQTACMALLNEINVRDELTINVCDKGNSSIEEDLLY